MYCRLSYRLNYYAQNFGDPPTDTMKHILKDSQHLLPHGFFITPKKVKTKDTIYMENNNIPALKYTPLLGHLEGMIERGGRALLRLPSRTVSILWSLDTKILTRAGLGLG